MMPDDAGAGRRPNILILMADQLTPGILPAYGNDWVRTPVIDRLAADGVVFDAAYCNSPLCAPSRATFMTGQLPSRHGVYDNAAEFAAETPTFAHHLRALGYRTILTGKMHFCGADQLHGFEERLTTDIYPADFGWTPDWSRPGERPSWYHNMKSVIDAGPCIRTNQLDFDEEVVHTAERRLFDLARDRDRRPFLMVVSLTHPHDPFAIPARWWDLYTDSAIGMPRVSRAEVADDPHSARIRFVCETDRDPPTEAQVRAARRAYSGAVSYVDAQFGRVLAALGDAGFGEDTVTILLSDHGEMLGERGLWYKMSFFEGSARIPLIVHAPGRFGPARVAAPVSSADILPSLVDLAGGGPPAAARIDGHSLVPHLAGGDGHDTVFGEYLAEGAVAPIVMVRRDRWKLVHAPGDPDQLFDLASDPEERVNRAADPACAATLAALRAAAAARWDLGAVDQAVRDSQRRRLFVSAALRQGRIHGWDWAPPRDATAEYIRNHLDLDDLEAAARFPRVVPAKP
jgi:choline-sulfatase